MEVIYYTDPLCCWSWVMEPQWRRFRLQMGDRLTVRYKMGGLLPSWGLFHDSTNAIRRPAQMGPEWMHAKHISGVDLDPRLWSIDPPASSFPACIAVKSAELQSPFFGEFYLGLAREAAMLRLKNIARTEVLTGLADELGKTYKDFDPAIFRRDLGEAGQDAFKRDWQEIKYTGISRFPAFVFKVPGRSPILLSGYQTYEELLAQCP